MDDLIDLGVVGGWVYGKSEGPRREVDVKGLGEVSMFSDFLTIFEL